METQGLTMCGLVKQVYKILFPRNASSLVPASLGNHSEQAVPWHRRIWSLGQLFSLCIVGFTELCCLGSPHIVKLPNELYHASDYIIGVL